MEKFFVAILFFLFLTLTVFFLGNPSFGEGFFLFYWHYIPEMISIFFLGFYFMLKLLKWFDCIFQHLIFVFIPFAMAYLSGVIVTKFSICGFFWCSIIISPYFLGVFYGVVKWASR